MNTCIFLPLSFLALTLSTSALGECTAQVREFIGNSGGTKAKAIAKAKDLNAGLRRAGPIAQLSKKERMELFAFGDEQEKELIADIQSCTERDLASINPSSPTPSGSATSAGSISSANCPDETSSEYAIFKYLGNGRFACANKINRIFGDCMTAANVDTWFKGSPMGLEAHEQRSVVAWAHCKLDNDRSWNAKGTQAQVNVGNASEVNGRKEDGKSAWKRGDSQTSQSQPQHESDAVAQGSNGSPKSKYVSKDATHCVELVPKGFKCDGPYDRFLTNICMTKISVRWRLGSDPWGMQELAPKGCTPVSPFRDQRSVQFKACSWDPKASHGPYSNPCRY